jgi:hypothetical protein
MEERHIDLPPDNEKMRNEISHRVLPGLIGAFKGSRNLGISGGDDRQAGLHSAAACVHPGPVPRLHAWHLATKPEAKTEDCWLGGNGRWRRRAGIRESGAGGLQEPKSGRRGRRAQGTARRRVVKEPPAADQADGVKEPPGDGLKEPPAEGAVKEPPAASREPAAVAATVPDQAAPAAVAVPSAPTLEEQSNACRCRPGTGYMAGVSVAAAVGFYAIFTFVRLEVFKMLLSSFFPLAVMILAVLGSIVFGLATPTEAAAIGSAGGFILAAAYKQLNMTVLKESVFLTAKTSAMVCWLFVGSSIFSAAFALLGGQEPGREMGALAQHDAAAVHAAQPVHHFHPRLAAGMDRDHRHLHADLHSRCWRTSTSIRCSSACWWRSTCRRPSSRRRWRWRPST